jgi:AraC-like DNA-binding protein
MHYHSCTPARPLSNFVERFWQLSDAPSHAKERIVPSGTIELVINLHEDEVRIYDPAQPARCKRFSGAVISGAYSEFFVIDTLAHALIVGVHFKPGGAFPFLVLPASELADAHVDLETLWGPAAVELRERLCAAANPTDRLFNPLEGHGAVRIALNAFGRTNSVSVREVARNVGLSQRRFIQVFSNEVGMTPKLFSRVRRFQLILERVQKTTIPNWAQLAAECGYFDQSHLINDFRTFSGLSPADYLRRRSERVLQNHVPLGK